MQASSLITSAMAAAPRDARALPVREAADNLLCLNERGGVTPALIEASTDYVRGNGQREGTRLHHRR